VADGREDAHVGAALGEHYLGGALPDTGDRADELDQLGVWLGRNCDSLVEDGNRLVERIDVREQLTDEDAVVADVEAVCERLAELRDLCPQRPAGELGELVGSLVPASSASSIARRRPSRLARRRWSA
jgi:hypothetical protein